MVWPRRKTPKFKLAASELRIFALPSPKFCILCNHGNFLKIRLRFWGRRPYGLATAQNAEMWNCSFGQLKFRFISALDLSRFFEFAFFWTREISTNAVFRRALKYWDVYTKIRAEKNENYVFSKCLQNNFLGRFRFVWKMLILFHFLHFGFVWSRTTIW